MTLTIAYLAIGIPFGLWMAFTGNDTDMPRGHRRQTVVMFAALWLPVLMLCAWLWIVFRIPVSKGYSHD